MRLISEMAEQDTELTRGIGGKRRECRVKCSLQCKRDDLYQFLGVVEVWRPTLVIRKQRKAKQMKRLPTWCNPLITIASSAGSTTADCNSDYKQNISEAGTGDCRGGFYTSCAFLTPESEDI
jgi:hypothetical protein